MDELSGDDFSLFPEWKQAVRDFVASGFVPGSTIPHEWFLERFGMDDPVGNRMTAEEYQERQFKWLRNMTSLREAARITRPGGTCFIFDLVRLAGDNAASEAALFARFHSPETMRAEAAAAGWRLDLGFPPAVRRNVLRELLADQHDAILAGCRPAICRFRRFGTPRR